jgi:hypothetical protein
MIAQPIDITEYAESAHGNRYATEDRESAYQSWHVTRSVKQVSEITGIPIGTLRSWSQRDSWTQRAESEDAERAELAKSHILGRVADEVAKSVEVLVAIRDDGGASNRDRRQAAVDILGIFGINVSKPDPHALVKPTPHYQAEDEPIDMTPAAAAERIRLRRERWQQEA